MLEDWQGGTSKQKFRETAVVKGEEGVEFVCHECSKKGHYFSDLPSTPAAANAAIMTIKKATSAAKKCVMDKNVEAENTEKEEEVDDGIPTYEEFK